MIEPTFTKRFVSCPNGCASEWCVEHLYQLGYETAGPWYCETCFQGWLLRVDPDHVKMTPHDRCHRIKIKLRLRPITEELTIVVGGSKIPGVTTHDSARYYYEEHTCTSNILRSVKEVCLGTEEDPHGLFEYLGEVEK